MPTSNLREHLEELYRRWHRPEFIGTDPLALVVEADPIDREANALLASSLAIGRADLATRAGRQILARVGPGLTARLLDPPRGGWTGFLTGIRYRFFSQARLEAFLDSLGVVLRSYGTLERAWLSTGCHGWRAIEAFCGLFPRSADLGILLPRFPSTGANKRINLFLRWMVRRDAIDPGGWSALNARELWMPIDTHVLQWARAEGLCTRKTADRQACYEITKALGSLSPEDPLRYDFSITREGMAMKGTLGQNRLF